MQKALNGLVLVGGRSVRMGVNKAEICWHKKQQQYYLADLLGFFCEEVFISCRTDQQQEIDPDYQVLPDLFEGSGPIEAILTAFNKRLDCAWLILACDLPLLDEAILKFLVEQRDVTKIATAFLNPVNNLPEPLVAIWEAESYGLLLSAHQQKHLSLRKLLIQHHAKMIKAPNPDALINANTPADAKIVKGILQKNASFIR
ncbi:NTP transferase domain-containing protein [Mucilaginibacter sp.]|uniref:NTP transferase domain-containing protein n=1 Tax=Mucilaginibacter sp. TaxID=1882438 RepID=UPI003B00F781